MGNWREAKVCDTPSAQVIYSHQKKKRKNGLSSQSYFKIIGKGWGMGEANEKKAWALG